MDELGSVPGLRAEAGSRPACESLSFASPKESHQRKGDPTARVPSLRYGQPAMLGQRVRRRTHCALRAPFKQLRQVSTRSACVLRHTHAPPALRFSARAEGNPKRTSTRAIASLRCARPRFAGASATRCASWAERSDGPNGCWLFGCSAVHPLLAAPAAGRLWGEHGRRSAHAS